MQMNEYQQEQMRTAPIAMYGKVTQDVDKDMLLNAVLGLSGETGEVADIVKKHLFQGHSLDLNKLIEEGGDVLWYLSLLAHACGVTLDEMASRNNEKLKKRYPTGFDSERSIHRPEYEGGVEG